jgi:probable DNA repair protein
LAQRLYDIAALEPLIRRGFTLLTPNHRLARHIKSQWDELRAAAGERTWLPLSVHALENWLIGRWELAVSQALLPPVVPLSEAQALELWRQVIVAQQGQSAQHPLLLPSAAAEIAHQARDRLRRWQVDIASPGVRQLFSLDRDCETFRRWLHAFETRLAKSGLCTPVDCLAQLLSVAGRLPRERAVLLEFDEIPPLLRGALDALCEEVREVAPAASNAPRFIHPFSDKRAELRAVAAWVAEVHRADPTATIGIVPADEISDRVALEYLLRREFDCLGENYNSLPVNFSTGIPLAQAPLVRDALAALSLGLTQTTQPAVVSLMHSRFLDLHESRGELSQRLLNRLSASGRETTAVAELELITREIALELRLGQCLQRLSARRELRATATASAWAKQFSSVLAEWGWPGRQPLDSVEYQQLEQWDQTLDEFRAFSGICGKLRYGDALQLLRDCCARRISHPQTADSPIHVLGPLEAAGLAFDHLWLCGMQAATWPASPRPNPFIPIALQSRLGMPHANPEREQVFSSALLQRLSRSSRALHASYARQIDGVPDAPSAMLQDFDLQIMPEPPVVPLLWTTAGDQTALEQLADDNAPRLDEMTKSAITGGSRVLEDQSHCPFRAFARHRLRLAPQPQRGAALASSERGSLLHAALNALWGSLGDLACLQALGSAALEQAVVESIDEALRRVPAVIRRGISEGYWSLERQRLTALLREWLSVERQRSAFQVEAREQAFAIELAGLPLRLRVDRIDQLPDGSRVIIDYKSGKCSVLDWMGDRPALPQLLLYAVAEPGTAAAVAFAQVTPRACGFVGLGRVAAAEGIRTDIQRAVDNRMAAQDWETLNASWRETLERLAKEFVCGEAQVDPRSAASCERCGLQPLCRISAADTTGENAR